MGHLPSGKLTICYWKKEAYSWSFPSRNGDFPSFFVNVSQRPCTYRAHIVVEFPIKSPLNPHSNHSITSTHHHFPDVSPRIFQCFPWKNLHFPITSSPWDASLCGSLIPKSQWNQPELHQSHLNHDQILSSTRLFRSWLGAGEPWQGITLLAHYEETYTLINWDTYGKWWLVLVIEWGFNGIWLACNPVICGKNCKVRPASYVRWVSKPIN